MIGEIKGDPGQQRWGRIAAIGATGLAVAAVAVAGRGHASAVTVGALGSALALAAVDLATDRRSTDDLTDVDLRLAVVEGRIDLNEERIGRVLGLVEARAQGVS